MVEQAGLTTHSEQGSGKTMDIVALLDEIQTIARNGLHYARDPFDRERYERLMQLATESYGEMTGAPAESFSRRFMSEIGYITPKVGADAAIFNDQGEILLMDRADGTGWCLPCGWVEPNEKPAETVVREVREETGLDVEISRLVGVFTRMPSSALGPHTLIAVVHLCEVVGGNLTLSHEGRALQYWPIDEVRDWFATHERCARAAHGMRMCDRPLPAVSD